MPGIDKSRFINIGDNEEELCCGICLGIFVNPKVARCCGHTFCGDCVRRAINLTKMCPHCGKKLSNNRLSKPPPILINLLNKQKMKCDFSDNGCVEELLYDSCMQHIRNCRYNSEAICYECGEKNGVISEHNCVQILCNKYQCIKSLQTNNEELSAKNASLEMQLLNAKKEHDEQLKQLSHIFNSFSVGLLADKTINELQQIDGQLSSENAMNEKISGLEATNKELSDKCEQLETEMFNLMKNCDQTIKTLNDQLNDRNDLIEKFNCREVINKEKTDRKRTKPSEPDLSSKTNAKKLKTNVDDRDHENVDSSFPLPNHIVFDIEDSETDMIKNDLFSNESNNQNIIIIDLDAIFMGTDDEDLPAIDNLNNTDDSVNWNDCNDSNTVSSDKNIVSSGSLAVTASDSYDHTLSENNETVVLFKERRRLSNDKLLQCIKHGKVETHLVGVYRESIFSERHRKFKCGSELEKNQLKHMPWFGPINDEDQKEDIYDYCSQLLKRNCRILRNFDIRAYIFEVCVPEAIVKAISSVRRIELKDAELVFAKGVVLNQKRKK